MNNRAGAGVTIAGVRMVLVFMFSAVYPAYAQHGGPPRATPVRVAPVEVATVDHEISAIGTLRADESVMIRSEVAGRIVSIEFNEGQGVNHHRPLLHIDAAVYQAQLAASSAAVHLDKLNYDRTKELLAKKLASRQDYDQAKAKLDESLAREAIDRVNLEKTVIQAPFAGVMGLRQVSVGALVQPGQDLVRLDKVTTLKLDFRIAERYLAQVEVGQALQLQVDAYPGRTFNGQIYVLDNSIDEATRTLAVRARLANEQALLRPGMYARVTLRLDQRQEALVVPEQAVLPKGESSFIFRVVDGKAQQVKVKLGLRQYGSVEVLEGLTAGDQIVTDGQTKLRDGAEVLLPGSKPKTEGGAAKAETKGH